MIEETEGERRVDELGREAFERAVTRAATIATQAVAQVHRRRLVTQTAIATFVICIGVALVLAFVLKGAADQQSRALALSNCHFETRLATPLANFVQSDATLRQKQAALGSQRTPIGRKFARFLGLRNYAAAVKKSNELNAEATNFWEHTVVPQLRAVAGADCELRLP